MSARPEEISTADLANLARAAGFTPVRGAMEGADWIGDTAALRLLVSDARAAAPSDAAADVLAERQRRQKVEGWTAEHDDQYDGHQLSAAAACYALHTEPVGNVGDYLRFWPWLAKWWKPTDRRRNLVKAAALLIAEIERMDRAAP